MAKKKATTNFSSGVVSLLLTAWKLLVALLALAGSVSSQPKIGFRRDSEVDSLGRVVVIGGKRNEARPTYVVCFEGWSNGNYDHTKNVGYRIISGDEQRALATDLPTIAEKANCDFDREASAVSVTQMQQCLEKASNYKNSQVKSGSRFIQQCTKKLEQLRKEEMEQTVEYRAGRNEL